MTSASAPSSPSALAERVIADGFRMGLTPLQVQERIRKELGERLCRSAIRERMEAHERGNGVKRFFKKKGSDIVAEFLEKAREGTDVSDLEAVLANAVYVDLLRRYASESDPLMEIGMKDLIKMGNEFSKLRLSTMKAAPKTGGEGLSAGRALDILEIVEGLLADEPEMLEGFRRLKPEIVKEMGERMDRDEFDEARREFEAVQELKERYENGNR